MCTGNTGNTGNKQGKGEANRVSGGAAAPETPETLKRAPDFDAMNAAALRCLPDLLARWLPDGTRRGREHVARNPCRADRNAGSFSVNVQTGRWADFATGDRGGDPISLAAFLFGLSQVEAARRLAAMLGLPGGNGTNG